MPSKTNQPISQTYKRDLTIDQSTNTGIDTATRRVQSGDGANSCMMLSDDALLIQPINDNTANTFKVQGSGGEACMVADTTNQVVKSGSQAANVQTNLIQFGIRASGNASTAAGYHYPMGIGTGVFDSILQPPDFGNGTDPATSFTTADANTDKASDLACCMWYIPLHITIDSVMSIQGADAATGDTTRLHLFSYDLTSGHTSALSNGTLIAHTSSDITNAGSEQLYTQAFTIDSADVNKEKVLMCFFEQDSVNSDISYNVQIRYHFR